MSAFAAGRAPKKRTKPLSFAHIPVFWVCRCGRGFESESKLAWHIRDQSEIARSPEGEHRLERLRA